MKKVISLFLSILMLFSTMTGLTFSAQAKEQITKIMVNNVPEPYIGATIKDLCFFSVPDWAEYEGFSKDFTKCMLWFDLTSDTPPYTALPLDTVCVAGHAYGVSIRLMAVGNTFASEPEAYLNGVKTVTEGYLGRNKSTNLAVEYRFPTLKKKSIDNINAGFAFDKFENGITVNTNSISIGDNRVSSVSTGWFHNGTAVKDNTTVTYGDWGFVIGLVAADTTYFDKSSTITIGGEKLTPTNILNGKAAFFRTKDDFFTVECAHNYSSSWSCDGTTHWKQCSICGDKSELNTHTFDAGVKDGDTTTYTCSECSYKKVDKYIENGFRYADVDGGVQVVTYKGNDVNVNVPATLGGKKVVSIADYAFATATNKTAIKSITLPSAVKSIGRSAFNGCSALTSINIPSGVTRIEKETFLGCGSLGNIVIPYGVTFIGENAFQGCGISSIVIPCSVNTIKSQAFRGCNNLGSVVVPDSVTTLETGAFISCANLKSVVIGDRVTIIPDSVFDACSSLEAITLPAGLTSIGRYNLDNKANFNKIYFRGTQEQWNAVTIGKYNDYSATVEYNYSAKTDVGQHRHSNLTTIAPTCIDEGFVLNVCEGCGDSFKTDAKAPTGIHTYNSGSVAQEATCEKTGIMVYTCNVCGKNDTQIISATGHNFGSNSPACLACGVANPNYVAPTPTPTPTPAPAPAPAPSNVIIFNGESIKPNSSGEYVSKKAKKPSIKKLKKGKKAFTVTYSKIKGVSGYQVQYSTSKKFTKKTSKKVTYKGNKKFTKTVKKLKGAKKYYVRVRTYKTVNGKKVYSGWSKAKTVTTKK